MSFNNGGGGGIASASDVALNTVANNQVLSYDTSIAKWKNVSPAGGGTISSVDQLPVSVPATIVWTGSAWPARTTVTSNTSRVVFYVGNPGGTGPSDAQPNDVWTQG